MNYKLCPKCGFREAFKDAMDIYTITDRNVFWSCSQCSAIETISLIEFLFRSEKRQPKAARKDKMN